MRRIRCSQGSRYPASQLGRKRASQKRHGDRICCNERDVSLALFKPVAMTRRRCECKYLGRLMASRWAKEKKEKKKIVRSPNRLFDGAEMFCVKF